MGTRCWRISTWALGRSEALLDFRPLWWWTSTLPCSNVSYNRSKFCACKIDATVQEDWSKRSKSIYWRDESWAVEQVWRQDCTVSWMKADDHVRCIHLTSDGVRLSRGVDLLLWDVRYYLNNVKDSLDLLSIPSLETQYTLKYKRTYPRLTSEGGLCISGAVKLMWLMSQLQITSPLIKEWY